VDSLERFNGHLNWSIIGRLGSQFPVSPLLSALQTFTCSPSQLILINPARQVLGPWVDKGLRNKWNIYLEKHRLHVCPFMVSDLAHYSTLKMEVVFSFETSSSVRTKRRYSPQYSTLHSHRPVSLYTIAFENSSGF
jgi:hypothetical protein